ncbi:hypothetical protein [uncultured Nocardioides sp.]|uniref:hypothetical protein n=1 Tax=uncultured Nocardioides sp. TaxID=198441 RepID=UPI0026264907|nr:hypothetical protein [uncultured Nocardioides sp.]
MKTIDDVKELLGTLPDDEVAELAGVDVQTVEEWRRSLELPPPAGQTRDPAPKDGRATKPQTGKPATRTLALPRPAVVQATAKARLTGPNGRTLRLDHRGIYRGELAQWLWEHHRDLVKPYPPKE